MVSVPGGTAGCPLTNYNKGREGNVSVPGPQALGILSSPCVSAVPHSQEAGPELHMTTGANPLLLESTGVSQLMKPQALGPVVRATAMLYFRLCPSCTIRRYEAAAAAFWQPPVRPPTLVFYSLDDPLCDSARLQELLAAWQRLGMPVWVQAWATSRHAAHLRQHPLEYSSTLVTFLGRLGLAAPAARL